jgi:hypothetical protein
MDVGGVGPSIAIIEGAGLLNLIADSGGASSFRRGFTNKTTSFTG